MTNPVRRGRKRGKPIAVVKQGSAAVPIYRGMVRGRIRFTVAFYLNGRRQRRTFATQDAAREEARQAALNIQRGMSQDNELRPQDREALRAAQALLADLGMPLVTAVEDYVQCRRKLGDVPLGTAVDEYLRRTRGFTTGVKVPQVVKELIAAKRQDRMSEVYLSLLQSVLGRFKDHFSGEIASVTTHQIEVWLRLGNQSIGTRNNWLKRVKVLFAFARQRGYLPKEPTAAETLKRTKQADSDVGIFTPEQMEKVLRAATSPMVAPLAIGGFAGLRTAELCRLKWSAVDLERRIIELRAGLAKTASRRIVPISDNLAAWLETVKKESGPVVPDRGVLSKITRLARKIGVGWPHNVLRHSFISYRIAQVQNAAQVALEAGNSPTIIFKHYRELVTKEEAEKWFGILPEVRS